MHHGETPIIDKNQLQLILPFLSGLTPAKSISVSQWSDDYRILPATAAEAGRWKTDRTPYLREILDKLSVNDPAQKVVFMKGSQIGGTEAGNNWLGYIIHIAPAPFIYIMPTDALMKKTSKQRIEKMIDATPELRAKIAKGRGKDSTNTLLYKEFPGGFISMVGANSPVGVSSTPAKCIYGDEIDRYPESVGNEGSVVDLADTRTSTFGSRRKIFLTSTPTLTATSQIKREFDKTGKRYYQCPCPKCGAYQPLIFEQLRYQPSDLFNVKYECIHCNELFEERYKTEIMKAGKWVPTHPDIEKQNPFLFGYHLSAMYSPYGMYSWSKMVQDFEASKESVPKTVVFVNTKLGKDFDPVAGDKPEWERIKDRAEEYSEGTVYKDVAFITAGVDVQKDRLEIEVVGWIPGKISQSIQYTVIIGETSSDDVWRQLGALLNSTFKRNGDSACMKIKLMAVDTGYNTQKVYEFIQQHGTAKVIGVKGRENLNMVIASPSSVDTIKGGQKIGKVKVWGVGTSVIKQELYGQLTLSPNHENGSYPDGYCIFPKRDHTYFRGLTAEELIATTNGRGHAQYVWVKKYKRNEPLDTRVYNRAAAAAIGIDRMTPKDWALLHQSYTPYENSATEGNNTADEYNDESSFWDHLDERLK